MDTELMNLTKGTTAAPSQMFHSRHSTVLTDGAFTAMDHSVKVPRPPPSTNFEANTFCTGSSTSTSMCYSDFRAEPKGGGGRFLPKFETYVCKTTREQ